jgi:hypothetical protein
MDGRAEEAVSSAREPVRVIPASLESCAWTNRGKKRSAETTKKSIPLYIHLPVGDLCVNKSNFNFTKLLYTN